MVSCAEGLRVLDAFILSGFEPVNASLTTGHIPLAVVETFRANIIVMKHASYEAGSVPCRGDMEGRGTKGNYNTRKGSDNTDYQKILRTIVPEVRINRRSRRVMVVVGDRNEKGTLNFGYCGRTNVFFGTPATPRLLQDL